MENKNVTINISTKTIIKIIITFLIIYLFFLIREVLLLMIIMLIIVAGLDPVITYFDKYKVPRWVSVGVLYALLLGVFVLLLYIIIPPMIDQLANLITNLPYYINKLPPSISLYVHDLLSNNQKELFSFSTQLQNISQSLISYILGLFGSITSIITVLAVSFYLLLKHDSVEEIFFSFVNEKKRQNAVKIYQKINGKLGNWLRSRLILSLIIMGIMYVVLHLLNVPYALMLAILTGLLDIVPIIGPIISGILMALVSYGSGGWLHLAIVVSTFIVFDQLKDNYISPKLLGKAIGLSPVLVILVFAIGTKLGGATGAILSIPVAAAIFVIIQEWESVRKVLFD